MAHACCGRRAPGSAGGWRERVLLRRRRATAAGPRSTPDVAAPPTGAESLAGPVLPGLVDAHSHAFQRAFAGLAERRDVGAATTSGPGATACTASRCASRPEQLRDDRGAALRRAAARRLHAGLRVPLPAPRPRRHAATPTRWRCRWALADAAAEAGIGLTLLPVLYERAGFAAAGAARRPAPLRDHASTTCWRCRRVARRGRPLVNAGVAIHSLRAARPESIARAAPQPTSAGPIHIHVAEQTAEVDDCLAATGCAADRVAGARMRRSTRAGSSCTRRTPRRPRSTPWRARGAGVVALPEHRGQPRRRPAPTCRGWLAAGVPLAIGSDSQVTRDWREELRWLEYGQRLALRRRNVAAAPERGEPSTAARLFERVRAGGARGGRASRAGACRPGARADLLVVDPRDPALRGLPADHLLDGVVFIASARPFARVMVAGRWQRAARRRDRGALRGRDAGTVGARRHANAARLTARRHVHSSQEGGAMHARYAAARDCGALGGSTRRRIDRRLLDWRVRGTDVHQA